MESVHDLLHSAVSRWRCWSVMQRTIFGLAAGVILAGALSAGFQSETTRYVPLSLGKQVSDDELTGIEQSLRERSLTTFRRKGKQLLVPEDEQTAYDAALLQERPLSTGRASEWEEKLEATNPFTSSRKLKMMQDIALKNELTRIIQDLDGIEEAKVVWAETQTNTWPSRRQKVTATVNIRPEPGHELAEQTIRAIQFSVANMVPNLEPQDVIVLDCSLGRHYQLQPEQARFETDLGRWIDREVSRWHERLLPALEYHWPGARLLIRPQHDELRQIARPLIHANRAEEETMPAFHTIEPELELRFPECMRLTVTLPNRAAPQDSPPTAPEQEVLAALIGWLPPSFEGHQLQVTFERLPGATAPLDVAGDERPPPAWQPVIMIGAAGLLLLLVGRRFRSPSSSSSETGLKPAAEPANQSGATGARSPAASAQMTTPLGDPEQVADVLKHWLGCAHDAGEAGSSESASREAD